MTRLTPKFEPKRFFGVLALLIALVLLDRGSKVYMEAHLAGRDVVLIPHVLGLHLLEGGNTGAAFGSFSGNTLVLIVLTGLVIAALLYALLFLRFTSGWMTCAALLVTAGGAGNLYDRIFCGAVTDFFRFLFIDFPIFNVADCYITIGAVLLVGFMLFSPRRNDPIFVSPAGRTEEKPETERDHG